MSKKNGFVCAIEIIIFIFIFLNTQIHARRYTPLLVEEDGTRRNNRAAGKLFIIINKFDLQQ